MILITFWYAEPEKTGKGSAILRRWEDGGNATCGQGNMGRFGAPSSPLGLHPKVCDCRRIWVKPESHRPGRNGDAQACPPKPGWIPARPKVSPSLRLPRESSAARLNHAETGSRCSEIKLLQCFISSNTIALVKPKEVLFLSCRRKTKREMNLAARSDRAISSNDQPLASQLPQWLCCSVSKTHQEMARSGNMNHILLDVVSTGKSLKRITQEEYKHVYGDARISHESGNL